MLEFKHYCVIKNKQVYWKYVVKYRRYKGDRKPQFICLCNDKDTAEMIADSLNKAE